MRRTARSCSALAETRQPSEGDEAAAHYFYGRPQRGEKRGAPHSPHDESKLDPPIAFAPFLDQFADRLKHQYRLMFLVNADKKPTRQHVRLETEVPNAEFPASE